MMCSDRSTNGSGRHRMDRAAAAPVGGRERTDRRVSLERPGMTSNGCSWNSAAKLANREARGLRQPQRLQRERVQRPRELPELARPLEREHAAVPHARQVRHNTRLGLQEMSSNWTSANAWSSRNGSADARRRLPEHVRQRTHDGRRRPQDGRGASASSSVRPRPLRRTFVARESHSDAEPRGRAPRPAPRNVRTKTATARIRNGAILPERRTERLHRIRARSMPAPPPSRPGAQSPTRASAQAVAVQRDRRTHWARTESAHARTRQSSESRHDEQTTKDPPKLRDQLGITRQVLACTAAVRTSFESNIGSGKAP
jgi:hypothetical protein